MKVRCVRYLDALGRDADLPRGLQMGQTYTVLSVVHDVHGQWLFRIFPGAPKSPALYLKKQFEIVDPRASKFWELVWHAQDAFELTCHAWATAGFWDRYYDDGELEEKTFRQQVALLETE